MVVVGRLGSVECATIAMSARVQVTVHSTTSASFACAFAASASVDTIGIDGICLRPLQIGQAVPPISTEELASVLSRYLVLTLFVDCIHGAAFGDSNVDWMGGYSVH